MRRITFALAATVIAALGAAPALATTGKCTVTSMRLPVANLMLTFTLQGVDGLEMPVEFDETTGTFSMSGDAFVARFGTTGAVFPTGFGPQGWLAMASGASTGTIDGGGNVVVRRMPMAFATDFCGMARGPDYPISPDLTTMTEFRVANNAAFPRTGTPMDASGVLVLDGVDLIPDACGAGGPTLSGARITCQLSPVPNLSGLPGAPALQKVTGSAKTGPELPTAPSPKPVKGDTLALKGTLANWSGINLATDDFFVRIRIGSGDTAEDVAVVRVPAGSFSTKGKTSKVVDKAGTVIQLMTGRKKNDAVDAATGGSVVLTSGKKGIKAKMSVLGLDLAKLAGSAELVLSIGPYSATIPLTASGSGKSRKLRGG